MTATSVCACMDVSTDNTARSQHWRRYQQRGLNVPAQCVPVRMCQPTHLRGREYGDVTNNVVLMCQHCVRLCGCVNRHSCTVATTATLQQAWSQLRRHCPNAKRSAQSPLSWASDAGGHFESTSSTLCKSTDLAGLATTAKGHLNGPGWSSAMCACPVVSRRGVSRPLINLVQADRPRTNRNYCEGHIEWTGVVACQVDVSTSVHAITHVGGCCNRF